MRIKREYLWIIIILIFYLVFLIFLFQIHEKIVEYKKSDRINISMLSNMSKDKILQFLKERQISREKLNICSYLYFLVAAISVVFGGISTYIYMTKIKSQCDIKKLLELLPKEEGYVISRLLESEYIFQSEISEKFGKVKAHRVIDMLEKRGVIEKYKHGKTYIIKLSSEFKKILKG